MNATESSTLRRVVLVVGVLVALLLAAAAVAWFVWLPTWRPSLRAGERYGVDVAAHQSRINWPQVAADDIDFAYIKATEGGDFVDEVFAENWRGAAAAGLDRGAYHFFTLCTPGDVQARHFLRVAPPVAAALAPAVDLELKGNCSRRPPASKVDAELDQFLVLVEEAWGRPVVLYVGDEYENRYPVRERLGRPLWRRRFLRRPNAKGWVLWQVNGYARVAGISGGVDLDVMRPRYR